MADKPDNKEKKDAAPLAADKKAEKKPPIWTKLPVLVGGVMVVEAVIMVGAFKFLGGSTTKSASAETVRLEGEKEGGEAKGEGEGGEGKAEGPKKGELTELPVTNFRAPNTKTGRRLIYDVAILATVKSENKAKLEGVLKSREATITDRVRTIIAQSEPEKLGGGEEPGLETLKRQVKFQLEDIVGEGLVEEVLVPRCIPFRGD